MLCLLHLGRTPSATILGLGVALVPSSKHDPLIFGQLGIVTPYPCPWIHVLKQLLLTLGAFASRLADRR
jgi:hypothetical protein